MHLPARVIGGQPAADRRASASASDRMRRAADRLEGECDRLIGLIVREAGKSLPNAVSEIREAVDFLRYYAAMLVVGIVGMTFYFLALT